MTLNAIDRFEIFEQLNLHQRCIDNDGGLDSVHKYLDLYWPNAKFTVNDLRTADFIGEDQIKNMYDFAHSVFPLDNWKHSLGAFHIEGEGNTATVKWSWIVSWRKGGEGVVSTGEYNDKFEKRNGVWKCVERVSTTDPNWPDFIFQPYMDKQAETFKAS